MAKRQIHRTVTATRVIEACNRSLTSLDNPGLCLFCGEDSDGCEPDARKYMCDACGERGVFDAEEIYMAGYYHKDAA